MRSLILAIVFSGLTNAASAQFFANHPNGTPTGQQPFVQDIAANIPVVGVSDLTLTPDGRLFAISDQTKIFELTDACQVLRTIGYTGSITQYSITGRDCEAIAWVNGDAVSDTFAVLHEGSRVVFFVDIPTTGDYTIDLSAVTAHIQCPGTGKPYESMRQDPFDPTRLIVSRIQVKASTLPPYEVDVIHDGVSPLSTEIDVSFVNAPSSQYQTIRSTFHPPLLPNSIAALRTSGGALRMVERADNGTIVSYQQIATLGTYFEGIATKRTVNDDGWIIFVCIDVNSTTANNVFRYVRMDP